MLTTPKLKETVDPRVTGLAGWRDASFYRKPGVATSYHVLLLGAGQTDLVAGCGARGPFFDTGAIEARDVPASLRCEREGCGQRWPT